MTTPGSYGPGQQPPGGGSGWGPPPGGATPGASQPGSVPPPPPPGAPGQYPPPQQGQYPPPQGQFGGQGASPVGGQGFPPHDQPQRKSGVGKWIGIAAAVLALVVVAIIALAFLGGGDPEAGDCLTGDSDELSVVDCDDEEAAYRVVGVQEGEQTFDEYQADPETCADFLDETTQSFWIGENGDETGEGVVYCVTDAI